MKKQKVYYYSDELNDDFANTNITRKELGDNFKYIHTNWFYRSVNYVFYYFIAAPIIWIGNKVYNHQKFVNKKVLKECKDRGYFVFSNHTGMILDSFSTPMLTYPKRLYEIVNPDAFSIRGVKTIVQMLGGVPLASSFKQEKEFLKCIKQRINEKQVISIFPEAHIWPYYTKVRPYSHISFKYPVKLNAPVYAVSHCYQKRKFFKKPKVVSFVDGPFYPNQDLPLNDASQELRDKVYNTMVKRLKENSTYEYAKYVKVDKKDETKEEEK